MKVTNLMDYTKIQCDIIKEYEKNGKTAPKYFFGTYKTWDGTTWTGIAIEGHVAVFIPDCMYYLDNNKVFYNCTPCDFNKMVNSDEYHRITMTNDLINSDGKYINVLKDDDSIEYFVNSKFIEIFTKTGVNINYTGKTPKTPILVYSGNDLIGLICPINYTR